MTLFMKQLYVLTFNLTNFRIIFYQPIHLPLIQLLFLPFANDLSMVLHSNSQFKTPNLI